MTAEATNEAAYIEAVDRLTELLESGEATPEDILWDLAETGMLPDEILVALREEWVTMNGHPVFIGDDGEGREPTKSDIAKVAHRGGSKYEQDIAEQAEKDLARDLGMIKSDDNRPFDLTLGKTGIECKTFISNTNSKVTQKTSAMENKLNFIKDNKLKKTFTVVVDRRSYDAQGKITGIAGPETYYVRDGYGSFRLNSMKQVTIPQLKAYIVKRSSGRFSL